MPDDNKSSGDATDVVTEIKRAAPAPAPVPPKVPDVELTVDGFGFMPKSDQRPGAKAVDKTTKVVNEILLETEETKSPCASSTNIDIVRRYTWRTKNRMSVQVISYGATITSIKVPDRKGVPDDVVAGFDSFEEYLSPRNPYFGATLGRYANIVANGTMVIKPSGRMYMLSTNRCNDHYNGGYIGFDKVNWRSYVTNNKVIMSHVSERYHEGYPGTVMAQVSFEVTCDNTLKIEMKCTTSEPTIINLSNSVYFNLAGHNSGLETMMEHMFTINADKFTATDENGLVTGEKKVVGGTAYDFRVPRVLKTMISKIPMGGYDINYCITQGTEQDITFQARVLHPGTGRVLELYSNQPGMQFYTGNKLPNPDEIVEQCRCTVCLEDEEKGETNSVSSARDEQEDEREGKVGVGYVPLSGKGGTCYRNHSLFSLMPQNYPDAINHRNFPNSILYPGQVYVHRIQYKFGLLLGKYV